MVFTLKALIIVILGGVGDIRGTIVAAFILGFAETAVATLIDPGLTLAAAYILFMLVLLVRPEGLFGRRSSAEAASTFPPREGRGLRSACCCLPQRRWCR